MNRILKSALVVVAFTAGSAFAEPSATQEITGNVQSGFAISVTGGTAITLTPGTTATTPSTLTVNATGAYVVTAETDKANMTEHDGSDYVLSTPATLQSTPTLTTSAAFGTPTTDVALAPHAATGLTVFSGTAAVADGSVTTTFKQPVAYDDEVLDTTNYKIVITYTIAPAA